MVTSWIEKRNRIAKLIKLLSDCYGGDDPEFLREYFFEIIDKNKDNLQFPLDCFEDLYSYCDIDENLDIKEKIKLSRIFTCIKCGYNPPFCLC